jgi:hypothetical protein
MPVEATGPPSIRLKRAQEIKSIHIDLGNLHTNNQKPQTLNRNLSCPNKNKYSGIHWRQSPENYTTITTASQRSMMDTLSRTGQNGHDGRGAELMRDKGNEDRK